MVDDGEPVAELVGLFHVVRGEQDRLPGGVELSFMMSHKASRLCGSSPAVGSSRNSTWGRCMMARATISRWAMPPDNAMTGVSARSARRTRSSMSIATGMRRLRRHPEVAAVELEVLGDGHGAVEGVEVWGTTPMTCLASAGLPITSTPPTSAVPDVGMTRGW